MSFRTGLSPRVSSVVLSIIVAVACATPIEDADTDSIEVPETGGTGGAAAGMPSVAGMPGSGGANPMGTGGMMMGSGGATGGRMGNGGDGGSAKAGTGGSAAGRASGGGSGGGGAGKGGGSGGVNAFGGAAGMASGGRGSGGMGMDLGGRTGSGGRGSGGTATGGRGTAGSGTGGGAGTGGGQKCVTSLMPNQSSGDIGTGAVCFDISGTMMGWQVSNLGTRTLTVNGMAAPTAPAVPPAVDGHRVFAFGAGMPEFTSFSYW